MTGEQVGLWVDSVLVKFDKWLMADELETVELMVVGKVGVGVGVDERDFVGTDSDCQGR